jgi:hypothetical protein
VSLHGSLETFALPDVLALLSSTHKTGELRIVGDRSQGSVWVDRGGLVQTAVPRAVTHVDALFELLRLPEGMFTFEQDVAAPKPEAPIGLDDLVVEAQLRLEEWRAIEAVVPSTEAGVKLQADVDEDVTLTPEQWKVLVAAVDGGTVGSVAERLTLGEFDACRCVRDLVDLSVIRIVEAPAKPKPSAKRERPAPAPVAEPVEAVVESAPVEAVVAGTDEIDESVPTEVAAEALAAFAGDDVATEVSGPAAAGDALDQPAQADETDEADETVEADDDDQTPLPGQPLPAWALAGDGDDDDAAAQAARLAVSDPAALEELVEGEEPINRGLLLKFLSSVRS